MNEQMLQICYWQAIVVDSDFLSVGDYCCYGRYERVSSSSNLSSPDYANVMR